VEDYRLDKVDLLRASSGRMLTLAWSLERSQVGGIGMSAMGHKQTFCYASAMSASNPKADIRTRE